MPDQCVKVADHGVLKHAGHAHFAVVPPRVALGYQPSNAPHRPLDFTDELLNLEGGARGDFPLKARYLVQAFGVSEVNFN